MLRSTAGTKIGNTNFKSRVNRSNRLSETEYLSIPKSFLAFLVGFIDGDGYIGIKKSYKDYVTIHLTISIHLDDLSILNHIQSVLKIGNVYTYPSRKSPTARLEISKIDLQEILFPLLLYHNLFFLTKTRRAQYDKAMYILNNDVKFYSDLPLISIEELYTKGESYLNLPFFKD